VDESLYQRHVHAAFRKIEDALSDVDPDLVDVTSTGDVVTLALPKGLRCVINTQRPTRQIWMAVKDSAWHFSLDPVSGRWLDDKGRDVELFANVSRVVKEFAGLEVAIG
jgi:CyaY protein